ncbi:MAG: PilZ domain-containing protein [Candidatus Omnitrophica bacterium]|nr:PilZ domain-containing protein [Candidatus Omnitrophota bacterium]
MYFIIFGGIALLALTWVFLTQEEAREARRTENWGRVSHMWTGPERRRALRVGTDLYITYHKLPLEEQVVEQALSEDISTYGAGLILPEKFEVLTDLVLTIHLPPDGNPLAVKGRVRWRKTAGRTATGQRLFYVGVDFLDVDENKRKHIEAALGTPANEKSPDQESTGG